MRAVDLIRKKRDGNGLNRDEVDNFVTGATDGSWPDYQLSALLMAIVLRGMSDEETAWLTEAMARSGARLDLSGLPGKKVDKHSTGGVGDKTSLVLAPLAAACGVVVPMMSGRGLGHTGGTLDKLEAIPGFRVDLSSREIVDGLAEIGCLIVGQTRDIAPADRRLYRLRDVTATVESIPLITASIMSKKLAEGIDGLVLDVKVGRGAFMKTVHEAEQLAQAMSVLLAARMVLLADCAGTPAEAEQRVREAMASGAGVTKFRQMVARQGGDPAVVDDPSRRALAAGREMVRAPRAGYGTAMDAMLVGRAAAALGAGRATADDKVDHGVGIRVQATLGALVRAGEPILELYHRDGLGLRDALDLAGQAIEFGGAPPAPQPLVVGEIV